MIVFSKPLQRVSLFSFRKFHFCSILSSSKDPSGEDVYADIQKRVHLYRKELRKHVQQSLKHRQLKNQIGNLNEAMAKAELRKNEHLMLEPVPSRISLEILSSGTCNMEPCVLLRTPTRGYLINCPESTSRMLPSMMLRANNINDILITSPNIRRIGGISGFMLSQCRGVAATRIHGPGFIRSYLEFLRPFADAEFGEVKYPGTVIEQPWDSGPYKDVTFTINYIPMQHFESNANAFEPVHNLDERESISYLIETNPPVPKIDMTKIMEKKVPKGPLIGKLKNGETIVLPDGRKVTPQDVYADEEEPGVKDSTVLVIDAVTMPQFNQFMRSPTIQPYITGSKQLDYIVHFTKPEIFDSEEYQNFSLSFDESKTTQIIANGSGAPDPHLESVYRHQNALNYIDGKLFPKLWPDSDVLLNEETDKLKDSRGRIFARPLQRYVLRGPEKKWIEECQIDLRRESNPVITKVKSDKILDTYSTLSTQISPPSPEPFPKIIFFGTASAVPSKYRNVTSVMVQTESSFYLIDCGEGTYGQIKQFFGDQTSEVLSKLKVIFITHTHQDHTNGLVTMLQERQKIYETTENIQQLVVVCNRNILKHMHTFSKRFYNVLNWAKFIVPMLYVERQPSCIDLTQLFEENGLLSSIPDITAAAVKVNHTSDAAGYIITTKDSNRKLVFSGDTTPCDLLIEAGKDAHVLVHEATFEDDYEADARSKKHSTMLQAVNVGKAMNAKHIILTHFSARYSKVPPLPDYLKENGVGIAMDNLVVSMDSLTQLPLMNEIYKKIYEEELFDIERKAQQRGLRNVAGPGPPPAKKRAFAEGE